MIKNISENNNKKLIISHIADVDGISALLLAKLHYEDLDYALVEFSELEDFLKSIIEDNSYKKYEDIIVTDVSFRNTTLELINQNEELKNKIRHFDHHATETSSMEKYPFVNEVLEKNGKAACGTTLFYDYIKDDFKYNSEYLNKYLEAVRAYDTKGPYCANQYGVDLTTLFSIIGIDNYIKKFSSGIKTKKDPINEDDIALINLEYQKIQDYIDQCDKTLIRIELDGNDVGVSISELYRSAVGNSLSNKYKDELDYILIINFMREQFSFRTVKDNINVGQIAKKYSKSGGGHPKAAGMPIDKDTIFILDLVKEAILKQNNEFTRKK